MATHATCTSWPWPDRTAMPYVPFGQPQPLPASGPVRRDHLHHARCRNVRKPGPRPMSARSCPASTMDTTIGQASGHRVGCFVRLTACGFALRHQTTDQRTVITVTNKRLEAALSDEDGSPGEAAKPRHRVRLPRFVVQEPSSSAMSSSAAPRRWACALAEAASSAPHGLTAGSASSPRR